MIDTVQAANKKADKVNTIIAIGASAGGLDPLKEFLANLPNQLAHATIIIAQHTGRASKHMLTELLSNEATINIVEAKNGDPLAAHCIYVCPPSKDIIIEDGHIILQPPVNPALPKPSIDILFKSIAGIKDTKLVGIILSGKGTDGSEGIVILKKAGGAILVQDPATAKFDSMPQAAIEKNA